MVKSVILSATRTPFGKLGGVFKNVSAVDLGAEAMKAAIQKSGVDKKEI